MNDYTVYEALFRIVLFCLFVLLSIIFSKLYLRRKKNNELEFYNSRKRDFIEFTRFPGDNEVMKRVRKKRELLIESDNQYGVKVHAIIWENTKEYTEHFEQQFLPRLGKEAADINKGLYKRYNQEYSEETKFTNLLNVN
mgnify:CR=1 FL=1